MRIMDMGKIREATKEEEQIIISNEKLIEERIRQDEINELKQKLADSDYKITKCQEYSLIGLELPYDVLKLHEERQKIRDEINIKESEVSENAG